MANNMNVARNDLSRMFIFRDGVDICSPTPYYMPCLGVDSLSQDFGDITRIECPDPYNYGKFIEVAQIPGEVSRITTTLTTRLSRTDLSMFREMAVKGCAFDLQLHWGLCTKPNDFNQFDKIMIFEDVYVTSYGTDPLVALQSADRDSIMETIDITAGVYYEVVPLTYTMRSVPVAAAAGGPIIDVTATLPQTCGAYCADQRSDGCSEFLALDSTGMIYLTEDGGISWTQLATDWSAADDVAGIGYLNGYVFVPTNDADAISGQPIIALETRKNTIDEVVPRLIDSGAPAGTVFADVGVGMNTALIVGTSAAGESFIGAINTSPDRGLTEYYEGVYGVDPLTKVQYTPGTDNALIVGENGSVIYYDGDSNTFVTLDTVGTNIEALNLTAALAVTENKWLVGDDAGKIWCSDDVDGVDWNEIRHSLTNETPVNDIQMSSKHVILASIGAEVLKSFDAGSTFVNIQSNLKKPTIDEAGIVLDILPCAYSPNKEIMVGDLAGAGLFITGDPA